MPNVLKRAAEWLHTRRHDHMTITVTYTRHGQQQGSTLKATVGRTGADQLIESNLVTSAGIRDYIFRTVDFLNQSGVLVPPKPLDTISEGAGAVWQVVEISGEPAWRYSDEYRTAIRVHAISNQVAS